MVVKLPTRVAPVTHRDLPDSDGEIVQNPYQLAQATLLSTAISPLLERLHGDEPFLLGSDSGIYWALTDEPLDGCKAPDWSYVPGVSAKDEEGERIRSYVIWSTNIRPLIVMEFVSGNGEEEHDRTPGKGKFWVYERGIAAKYYAIFDTFHEGRLELFELGRTGGYRPVAANERGHFPISDLNVELGVWQGRHDRDEGLWMRFFDSEGRMLPSGEERERENLSRLKHERQRAEQEQQRAEREKQRAEQEKARAEEADQQLQELLVRMKAKGIDPESL